MKILNPLPLGISGEGGGSVGDDSLEIKNKWMRERNCKQSAAPIQPSLKENTTLFKCQRTIGSLLRADEVLLLNVVHVVIVLQIVIVVVIGILTVFVVVPVVADAGFSRGGGAKKTDEKRKAGDSGGK